MTRSISLIQLGAGRIGSAAAALIQRQDATWRASLGIHVRYAAIADSTAFLAGTDAPLTAAEVAESFAARADGRAFASLPGALPRDQEARVLATALAAVSSPADLVVLDCATGSATTPLLLAARAAGAHAVLANKDPLTGPLSQFHALRASQAGGALGFSATVGAGLPIISSLLRAQATGDRLLTLSARASGSLGFLCDQLSRGVRFDNALRAAESQGFTEPDPRQDLSGFDVARKLLTLARVAGLASELHDVRVESLVPPGAEHLSREAFSAGIEGFASHLAERAAHARAAGNVLRYVAGVESGVQADAGPGPTLSASLLDLSPGDPLARGAGPENVFVLRTARYDANPLTIAGPGAGVAVTAGAVIADLLAVLGCV